MTRTNCTSWFVEPLNSHTNEAISAFLNGDPSLCQERKDARGKTHKVWECAPDQIRMIESEKRKNGNLKFKIMNTAGRDRPIKNFPFAFSSKPKKRNKKPAAN